MYCVLYTIFYMLKAGLLYSVDVGKNLEIILYLRYEDGKFLCDFLDKAKIISEEEAFEILYEDLEDSFVNNYLALFDPSVIDLGFVCSKCKSDEIELPVEDLVINCRFWNEGFICFKDCIYRQNNVTSNELVAELRRRM